MWSMHGKAGAAGRGDRGTRRRGGLKHHHQRAAAVPENHLVFRFGFWGAGIPAVCAVLLPKAGDAL